MAIFFIFTCISKYNLHFHHDLRLLNNSTPLKLTVVTVISKFNKKDDYHNFCPSHLLIYSSLYLSALNNEKSSTQKYRDV